MQSIKSLFRSFSLRSVKWFFGSLLVVGIIFGLGYLFYVAEVKPTTKSDVDKSISVGEVKSVEHVKNEGIIKTAKEEEVTVLHFKSGWVGRSNRFDGGEGFFTVDKTKNWNVREYYHDSGYFLCPEGVYKQDDCYKLTSLSKE